MSRVAVTTAHRQPVMGRAFGIRTPAARTSQALDTFTNFAQPVVFNHRQQLLQSQPSENLVASPRSAATAGDPRTPRRAHAPGREAGTGISAAMRSASAAVSTSASSGSGRTRSPAAAAGPAAAARCRAATSGRRGPAPGRRRAGRAARSRRPRPSRTWHPRRPTPAGPWPRPAAGRHLRRVHPDQHHRGRPRRLGVGQGPGDALVQAAAALGDDVEAGRQPRARAALQGEDPPRHVGGLHRGQRVGQGRVARAAASAGL